MASDRDTQIERIAVALRPGHLFEHEGDLSTCSAQDAGAALEHAAVLYDAGLRAEPDAGALRAALIELLEVIAGEGPMFNPDYPEDHGVSPEAAETIRRALAASRDAGPEGTA